MKKIFNILLCAAALAMTATGCELFKLDNYEAPNAQIYGTVIDAETGEPVGSEPVNGARLMAHQLDYGGSVSGNYYLKIGSDGTFRDNNIFNGTFEIKPYSDRNFINIPKDTIKVEGPTEYNIKVTPYLRVSEQNIRVEGEKVLASFKLRNNLYDESSMSDDSYIKNLSLFVANENAVSNAIRLSGSKILSVGSDIYVKDTALTISLDLTAHTADFKEGKQYYFRIGAQSNTTGASYNYGAPVLLTIPHVTVEEEGVLISDCEALAPSGRGSWTNTSSKPTPVLDGFNPSKGDWCIRTNCSNYSTPRMAYLSTNKIDTKTDLEHGVLKFDLLVSDPSLVCTSTQKGYVEITSNGKADSQELNWNVSSLDLHEGWNTVELPFKTAGKTGGTFKPESVNFFRIYFTGTFPEGFYYCVDNVRVTGQIEEQ